MNKIIPIVVASFLFLFIGTIGPVYGLNVVSDDVIPRALIAQSTIDTAPTAPTIIESHSSADLRTATKRDTDERVMKLKAYLLAKNSPLADESENFVTIADTYDLDWKLVTAISGVESTFGKHIPTGSHNGWGWGIPTGAQSGITFKNWREGIEQVSKGLRKNYLDRGAKTIEQIGRIYAASPSWSWKVHFFINQIESFSPNSPQLLSISL